MIEQLTAAEQAIVDRQVRRVELEERGAREAREWREARLHEYLFGEIVHPSECDDCLDGTHLIGLPA